MELDLSNCDDNEEANRLAADWCKQLGYNLLPTRSKTRFVVSTQYNWHCEIRTNTRQAHRLIITTLFGGKQGGLTQAQWCEFTNRINGQQSVCKFAIDQDGDLQVQASISFVDELSPRLFRNFITFTDDAITYFIQKERDVLSIGLN